jgi:hypothetical protein
MKIIAYSYFPFIFNLLGECVMINSQKANLIQALAKTRFVGLVASEEKVANELIYRLIDEVSSSESGNGADLSDYYTKFEIDQKLNDKVDAATYNNFTNTVEQEFDLREKPFLDYVNLNDDRVEGIETEITNIKSRLTMLEGS